MADQGRSQTTEVGLFTLTNGNISREVYLPFSGDA